LVKIDARNFGLSW